MVLYRGRSARTGHPPTYTGLACKAATATALRPPAYKVPVDPGIKPGIYFHPLIDAAPLLGESGVAQRPAEPCKPGVLYVDTSNRPFSIGIVGFGAVKWPSPLPLQLFPLHHQNRYCSMFFLAPPIVSGKHFRRAQSPLYASACGFSCRRG